LHGSQLATEIGFGDGGLRVRELSRAHNKSNHDKANKSLQAAYSQIATLCDSQNISKPTAETAKLLFRVTDDAKLFKGKSQDAIIAGCIFIACRNHGQQRSFREIFKMTNVSKKEVGRTFKTLEAYLQKVQRISCREPARNSASKPMCSSWLRNVLASLRSRALLLDARRSPLPAHAFIWSHTLWATPKHPKKLALLWK
jgi:hypothetical protein